MPQSKLINRRVVLASRPHGAPLEANFHIEQSPFLSQQKGRLCCVPFTSHLPLTCVVA